MVRRPTRIRASLLPLLVVLASVLGRMHTAAYAGPGQSPPSTPQDPTCPSWDDPGSPLPVDDLPMVPAPEVGSTAGAFSVSQTGDARYTIPLVVPPGRAGMQPSLAITYSSSAGQGLLGTGFGLAGLSAITRCPSNMAQDGAIRAVRNDEKDQLCLDGARLVLFVVSPLPDGGSVTEYRTFPETFANVKAFYPAGWGWARGPQRFEVYQRSGRIATYGGTDNGRELTKTNAVAAWWITEERDRRHNAIAYSYDHTYNADGSTKEIVPVRIDYTSHPTAPANRAVVFDTQSITPHVSYHQGRRATRSKVLSRIRMLGPGDTPVRSYGMTYKKSKATGHLLLDSVTECGTDLHACKPPTRFGWGDEGTKGGGGVAFTAEKTPYMATGNDGRAAWWLADVNGDGLDDLVLVQPDLGDDDLSVWSVALNNGGNFDPPGVWASLPYPDHHYGWESWTPMIVDYDQDGNTDIVLDAPNWASLTYLWLRARPDQHAFDLLDTGLLRPPPVELTQNPMFVPSHRLARLGDVNGDGIGDLIECRNENLEHDDITEETYVPIQWTVRLWTPSGFETQARAIDTMEGMACWIGVKALSVVDVDGDGAAEIVAPAPGTLQFEGEYVAHHFHEQGWEARALGLPLQKTFRKLLWPDLNGDGLPDVIDTWSQALECRDNWLDELPKCSDDTADNGAWSRDLLFKRVNHGDDVGKLEPAMSGRAVPPDTWTNWHAEHTTLFDADGDGLTDLLLPMNYHCTPDSDDVCWVILRSSPDGEGPFQVIDTHIPLLGGSKFYEWNRAEARDLDGDGKQDMVFAGTDGDGHFTIYKNNPAKDRLVWVSEGDNLRDPEQPGFVPTVAIGYGSLIDWATTKNIAPGSPLREQHTYLPRSDGGNPCEYPRACTVGPHQVVKQYTLNNGNNEERSFKVRYRDGRYHRLGRGFLGFGERIIVDLDTAAGSAEFYDNSTYDQNNKAFPFAGHAIRSWQWTRGLSSQPDPEQMEMTFTSRLYQVVPSSYGTSYFTLPVVTHTRRDEGAYPVPGKTMMEYIAATEGAPAYVRSESWHLVLGYDAFGNVLEERAFSNGVDLDTEIKRVAENDEDAWLLGKVTSEETCSKSLGQAPCRARKLAYNTYGEVTSITTGDAADAGTQLSVAITRDAAGNVVKTVTDDAFGHHRASCVSYDQDRVFPFASRNALGHTAYQRVHPGFGVVMATVDPNGLVTRQGLDELGRVAAIHHFDGTWTTIDRSRAQDGGPNLDWWTTRVHVMSEGHGEQIQEMMMGRVVRARTHGPEVIATDGQASFLGGWFAQDVSYDFLGRVAARSRPWLYSNFGPSLWDTYSYDAAGRVVAHKTPWNAVETFTYHEDVITKTDPKGTTTKVIDPIGRVITSMDELLHPTSYTYGPFGQLMSVVGPGNEVTAYTYDDYGRVIAHQDPNRGASALTYDGFGELLTLSDAASRGYVFTYDALGRLVERIDDDGTTSWVYDKAPHGIGKLAKSVSPWGVVRGYSYDDLSRPESTAMIIDGAAFTTSVKYDNYSRPVELTYPAGDVQPPLVVEQVFDARGYLLATQEAGALVPFWALNVVDGEGRPRMETYGNGVKAEREYDVPKGAVSRIYTRKGGTAIQDLRYTYDERLNVKSRTDALQSSFKEMFWYDALDRITCSQLQPPGTKCHSFKDCPCSLEVAYQENGNIAHKSDVGDYSYDPAQPHAVIKAGSGDYLYDPVGNQKRRPDAAITYTAFDLPSILSPFGGQEVTYTYDAEQARVKKSTLDEETISFEGLYERITNFTTGSVQHRYYVPAGLATVVVTREGNKSRTEHVHPDALGSTDVITDSAGLVVERQSYDAFGKRRSPSWGQPVPAAFPISGTSLGYTGHEPDALGLINMGGRILDPTLGRFLMTDPINSNPLNGQRWNAYSFVLNNPMSYVDPSGFDPADPKTWIYYNFKAGGAAVDMDGNGNWSLLADEVVVVGNKVVEPVAPAAPGPSPQDAGRDDRAIFGAAMLTPLLPTPSLPPAGAPGLPLPGPLNAPGPFAPNAFAPGSYVPPPSTPALPRPPVPAMAPGLSGTLGAVVGEVLMSAAVVLTCGIFIPSDTRFQLQPESEDAPEEIQAGDTERHHTIPLEIRAPRSGKEPLIPTDVANHPDVVGRKGLPNKWPIPRPLHRKIHPRYNERFKDRLKDLGELKPTVKEVLRIRDELVKEFNIEGYRP